jgi:hypothetical protein
MQRTLLQLCLATLLLCLWGCRQSTEPAPAQLRLTAEAGVVEAWLTINVENAADAEVLITRDGAERLRFPAVAETTVVDTGLLPAHNYSYAARLVRNGQTKARSNSVELTTMDTTSHDFTWEIYRFGNLQIGSSQLYDVAIVDENNIWAVGEISAADSLGNWVNPYNAVHWNGSEWELRRINFYSCPNGTSPTPFPIQAVLAFDENDIWFTRGGSIVHWDGSSFVHDCQINEVISGSIYKLWGTASNDLYAVGALGTIAHYDGQRWRRIESGTELDFQDIWGASESRTGDIQIFAVASKPFSSVDHFLLQLAPRIAVSTEAGIIGSLSSVWFLPNRKYYAVGAGVFTKLEYSQSTWRDISFLIPNYYREKIRGNSMSDVFIVGHYGLVSHYNGVSWDSFLALDGTFNGLATKGNVVVAVGQESVGFAGGQAVVLVGKRN